MAQKKWKPNKIRTLMVPSTYVVIPLPITKFDVRNLGQALKHDTKRSWMSISGRFRIKDRIVHGQQRPVAAMLDQYKRKIWIDVTAEDWAYKKFRAMDKKNITFFGRIYKKNKQWFIDSPEPIPKRWQGRPRPFYQLHHMTRRSLTKRIEEEALNSYLLGAKVQNEFYRSINDEWTFKNYLNSSTKHLLRIGLRDKESVYVALGTPDKRKARPKVRELLQHLHKPADSQEKDAARELLNRVAAVCVTAPSVKKAVALKEENEALRGTRETPILPAPDEHQAHGDVDHAARCLPFELTQSQHRAAKEILADLQSGDPMRRVLSGDVGSGKTAVFAIAVRAMIDAGFRVGIMLPRGLLAMQTVSKFQSFMPDVSMSVVTQKTRQINPDAQLWIGTVGLQHNIDRPFDLLIVDEQQQFSRHQREVAVAEGAHLLEVTATCIPRTQALLDTKIMAVSRLHKGPSKKVLKTQLWEPNQRSQLFSHIVECVANDEVVMVVYPGKNEQTSETEQEQRVYAVKQFEELWNTQFPGQVAFCHGDQKSIENDASIASVVRGEKRILVGTTVLEVGIDIERVRRMVIIQPERFGTSTLHQLRGRVAREGGTGYCDLMVIGQIKSKARKRLNYLCQESDGFKLAEFDMNARGAGDATREGHKQSGAMPGNPFIGFEPTNDMIKKVASELYRVYSSGVPSSTAQETTGESALRTSPTSPTL